MSIPLPCSVSALAFCLSLLPPAAAQTSEWVKVAPNGSLVYKADSQGNAIPDFSRAGYGGGGVPLPQPSNRVTVEPLPEGDDTERLQAAINELAATLSPGERGALLLKRGLYRVAGTLRINSDGVTLRGEGDGEDGTVILATGTDQRTLIEVGQQSPTEPREQAGTRRKVTERYVPWSATTLTLERTDDLAPGDRIVILRPGTAEWISAIGMDRIPPHQDNRTVNQWQPSSYHLVIERWVVGIEGKKVTLDAPLMVALDARYGGGFVYKGSLARIRECGIESLRLVSEYQRGLEESDEAHAERAIAIGNVENAWVRQVTMVHFSRGAHTLKGSIFATIQDCRHLDPVSKITGGRRYSFTLDGQYGLVVRGQADKARHVFATGSRVRGPNVFLEGSGTNSYSDSGPHHRWAIGTLYDNIRDRSLNVQNRQAAGSGHGWAGAQQVFWNCVTEEFRVQQPPTAQNYAIGIIGQRKPGQWYPEGKDGVIDSPGKPVQPSSLYRAQLAARLGPAALKALEP
jgi:hypothetical protein